MNVKSLLERLSLVGRQGTCPLIGGHRGASYCFPENTMAAFAAAVAMGADLIELDVQLTKDNVPIVLHDDTVDRTTIGHGLAGSLTFNEIIKLGIPALQEVLSFAANRIYLNIELKAVPNIGLLAAKVITLIKKYNLDSQVILSSFDHTVLPHLKQLNPAIATGILYEQPLADPVTYARHLQADALHPEFHLIQLPLVQEVHANQLYILTWTVDQPQDLHRLLQMPVDGVISNQPDAALAVAAESHIIRHE